MSSPRGRRPQRGFALVLALGAIAVVLLLAAALDAWVGARIEQARLVRMRVQDELDVYSTRATVMYLIATQRYTRAGLTTGAGDDRRAGAASQLEDEDEVQSELQIEPVGGEIALDGTPYRGLGRIRFSLQLDDGLVALNSESQAQLRGLLGSFERDETAVGTLLDALADYRDGNSMRRLNGAELEEYEAAGLPAPANRRLRSVPELLAVYGWRDWLAAHPGFRLHDWLSTARMETLNPNTAPASLLAGVLDIDPQRAAALVTERTRKPFTGMADFDARSTIERALDEELFRFFPPDRPQFQLRFWREGSAQAEVLAIQSTPLDRQSPWQIGSTYRITQGPRDEANEVPGELFRTGTPATP